MRIRLTVLVVASATAVGCSDDERRGVLGQPVGPCDDLVVGVQQDLDAHVGELNAFIRESASRPVTLRSIERRIRRLDGVRATEIVTKEAAYGRARELFKDSPGVMEDLPGNPFPASVEIVVDDESVEAVEDELSTFDEVDEVKRYGEAVRRMVDAYYARRDQDALCAALHEFPYVAGDGIPPSAMT